MERGNRCKTATGRKERKKGNITVRKRMRNLLIGRMRGKRVKDRNSMKRREEGGRGRKNGRKRR